MELQEYLILLRRWLWFILLSAFIAGSVAFISRSNQPRIYRAETKLVVGGITSSPDPDAGQIYAAFELVNTYAQLATTFNVLNASVQSLSLPITANELRNVVDTNTIANTSLLVISVQWDDPVLAADIANEVSNQLIQQSPSNLTPEQRAQLDIAQDQIQALTNELESLRQRLNAIDAQLANLTDQAAIARLSDERSTLIDQINQSTANIATFSNTIANIQQRTNTIELVEPAQIPTVPVGSSTTSATLLGAMVGAALAFGIVLLIEYLNENFRNADEVTRILKLPVLGVISSFGKSGDGYREKILSNHLFSQTLEEYRGLRVNLLFDQDHGESARVFLVTSPIPSDGKTLTATNLAVSIALSEKRVLLVDADLRRPKVDDIFNLPNRMGLSTFLTTSPRERVPNGANGAGGAVLNWHECIQDPGIPNLKVMTSGFMPNNPTELLGSVALKHWVDLVKASGQFDVIVFDTPPCLAVSDTVVLASATQADVVLVLRANRTKRNAAVKAKERFTNVGGKIAGVVLNATNRRDENYYGYYKYYYTQEPQPQKEERRK